MTRKERVPDTFDVLGQFGISRSDTFVGPELIGDFDGATGGAVLADFFANELFEAEADLLTAPVQGTSQCDRRR